MWISTDKLQKFWKEDQIMSRLWAYLRSKASPSASNELAIHTCKQTWNAAIDTDPCLAANEAAIVTQEVTAITLNINRNPESKCIKVTTIIGRTTLSKQSKET